MPDDNLGAGGAKKKFHDNINTIKTLKGLQESGASFVSDDDKKALVRYVGWGGLPQAFDPNNLAWKNEYEELKNLLTDDEYAQARNTTTDAHYTSEQVIQGIYKCLGRMGVSGPALVLEPAAGTGNFLGLRPEALKEKCRYTAIEIDPITANIGKFLYPDVEYIADGFQNISVPNGHFDLAIGNPPFGSQKVYDADNPHLDFSIHNYFLCKSIDSLRNGGIAAFVVSRYFLDAQDSSAREYIAQKANFLGAMRLPNTAFKQNALTEVTTDIVFFQKTNNPEKDPAWVKTAEYDLDIDPKIQEYFGFTESQENRRYVFHATYHDGRIEKAMHYSWGSRAEAEAYAKHRGEEAGRFSPPMADDIVSVSFELADTQVLYDSDYIIYTWLYNKYISDHALEESDRITLNQYFIDNPENIIGSMAFIGGMYKKSPELLPPENFKGILPEIEKRLAILPENIFETRLEYFATEQAKKDPRNLELCKNLKYGSFFVLNDGQIGQRLPDVLDKPDYLVLQPRSANTVKRIKGLIPLRDNLQELMRLEQLSDVDESELNRKRTNLNTLYDNYIKRWGYINSMGNKQAMKHDPAYPLLRALERDYDAGISKERAGKEDLDYRPPSASKAEIFRRRVLGPKTIVTTADTAKDAMFISMNECGRPDLRRMANLTGKTEHAIIEELEGFIFLNPANDTWEISDKYLTGNVKEKLKVAREAAALDPKYKINVDYLLEVQPPDLDAVDIGIQIGSVWVPADVMREFAEHLFQNKEAILELDYHPAIGEWYISVSGTRIDKSVNEATWGTEKKPGHEIFKCLLMNTPVRVRKLAGIDPETGKELFVTDEVETAAANQKADEMRQAFLDWVWTDAERRERLVKIYNDRFNTNIDKHYNGAHLDLPGSSLAITLRPHQKDVIWRGIQDGSIMADHAVGAGKTFEAIAIVMESKRMGLQKKPMIVVPNHLLGQWRDAFYTLYPQANILTAEKTDFEKNNRQALFAQIATGDWDAVIVPHSSFARIGLPEHTLHEVITEQVTDIVDAITILNESQGKNSGLIKRMERLRDALNAKLESQVAALKKDEALTFAELGVDALYVDESQEFKNLSIITAMRNVAGLGNVNGSYKAYDLYVKCRHIQKQNNGKGVFFLTGTPISNSIAEVYNIQRFLVYDELKARGVVTFDAWASTFGVVVNGWELDATGMNYKIKQRFAKFHNVPELSTWYRSFADVITQDDITRQNHGKSFVPKLKGGKSTIMIAERSEQIAEYMGLPEITTHADGSKTTKWTEGSIIHRMENLPRNPKIDNPLKITNDARKCGLDYRLIDPAANDYAGSKIDIASKEVYRIYQEWHEKKGTQLIFCDLSVPKSAKNAPLQIKSDNPEDEDELEISMDELLAENSDFSVYEDLKSKLIAMGIPKHEIAFIHDAKTDAQKLKLYQNMNKGNIRILMGSTAKMGAGMNVQRKIVGLHHLDMPWRPSDMIQRDGRGIRQGNEFFEADPDGFGLECIRYGTEKTYDARMAQTLQTKAESIDQFRQAGKTGREIEDIGGEAASSAEMKAAATGNPLILYQVQIASELKKYESLYKNFTRSMHTLEDRIKKLEKVPAQVATRIERLENEIAYRDQHSKDQFYFMGDNGTLYNDDNKKDLMEFIKDRLKESSDKNGDIVNIGRYQGYSFSVEVSKIMVQFIIEGAYGFHTPKNLEYTAYEENINVNGLFQRFDNYLNRFEADIQDEIKERERAVMQLQTAQDSLNNGFEHEELLKLLRQDNLLVMTELRLIKDNPDYQSTWRPQSLEYKKAEKPPVVALER